MEIRYHRVSWTFNEVGWDMYVPTFEMWRPRIFLYRCRRGYTHILVSPLLFVLLYHPPRDLGVNNNELGVCSDFKRVLSPFSSCPLLSSAWQSLRFWFPAFSLSCEPVMTARPTTCHLPLATCNPPRLDRSSLQPKPVSRTQSFLICIWSIQILKWALPVLCAAWLLLFPWLQYHQTDRTSSSRIRLAFSWFLHSITAFEAWTTDLRRLLFLSSLSIFSLALSVDPFLRLIWYCFISFPANFSASFR